MCMCLISGLAYESIFLVFMMMLFDDAVSAVETISLEAS